MRLKCIKLVILKILFVLGLRNFKFSFKIPRSQPTKLLPPTIQPPYQNKNLFRLQDNCTWNFINLLIAFRQENIV